MTRPVLLLHRTPFHRQQSLPFQDDKRFAGSERPALKERRAILSSAMQQVVVFLDASIELLV
jgi:hypothetical protein